MKLTKEDYMRLPKERLAELLVEADNRPSIEYVPPICVPIPVPVTPYDPANPFGPPYMICSLNERTAVTHPDSGLSAK